MKVEFGGIRKSNAQDDAGFTVNYAPAKRVAFRWRWYVMLVLVLSPLIYFFWFLTTERILTEAEGIITTEPIIIRASQSGVVNQLEVAAGDRIERGQRLFDLSSRVTDAKLDVLNANLSLLKAFQATVIERVERVLLEQENDLQAAMARLNDAASKYRTLESQGLLRIQSDLELERDRRAVMDAIKKLQVDQIRSDNILYSNDLANTIRDIEIDITTTQVQQEELAVRAVAGGIVNRIMARVGEFVGVGDPLLELSNYTQPVVNVYLKPERMDFAHQGQTAKIIMPDGSSHNATIRDPVRIAEKIPATLAGPFKAGSAAIKLVLRFDNPPENWIEGLPVKVRFPLRSGSERDDGPSMPGSQ